MYDFRRPYLPLGIKVFSLTHLSLFPKANASEAYRHLFFIDTSLIYFTKHLRSFGLIVSSNAVFLCLEIKA